MHKEKAVGVAAPHGLIDENKNSPKSFYQAPNKIATDDHGQLRSIGELSREIVVNCFIARHRVRPALGRVVFELANLGRRAA